MSIVMTVNCSHNRVTYPASCHTRRFWPPPWSRINAGPVPVTSYATRTPSLATTVGAFIGGEDKFRDTSSRERAAGHVRDASRRGDTIADRQQQQPGPAGHERRA